MYQSPLSQLSSGDSGKLIDGYLTYVETLSLRLSHRQVVHVCVRGVLDIKRPMEKGRFFPVEKEEDVNTTPSFHPV